MAPYTPRHAAPAHQAKPHRLRRVVLALLILSLSVAAGAVAALWTWTQGLWEPPQEAEQALEPLLVHIVPERFLTSETEESGTPTRVIVAQSASEAVAYTGVRFVEQALADYLKPEPESEPEPEPIEPAAIEVMMIGDVLMHDELVRSGARGDGSYDFGFLFEHIRPYLDACDLRILNQETVMGPPERGYYLHMGEVGPVMNTPTALADTEASLGFNLILKATNHVLDQQYEGLAYELDYWKAAHPEIPVVGVNNPRALQDGDDSQNYVDNVYIYEHDGMKVGILNYTWATNENVDWNTDVRVISYMREDKIRADVQKAHEAGAEMLIACPHWGIQYDTEPSEEEYRYARLFCELGVDVIFGCHPHILQRVEQLESQNGHRCVCFYSLGNFVAAGLMETPTLIGGVARVTLMRHEDGSYSVAKATLDPTVTCYTTGPHMSSWPILEWNNDLAAESFRSDLTVEYAHTFCAEVLGSGYDRDTGLYTLDLAAEPRAV